MPPQSEMAADFSKFSGRLAVVTEIISPYRIPVFNCVSEMLGNRFKVFFMTVKTSSRLWEVPLSRIRFDYEILKGRVLFERRHREFPRFWNPNILRELYRFRPSLIVLGGYHHPTSYAVWGYAKRYRTKLYLWCESNLNDHSSKALFIEYLKKTFIRSCDGYLVPGRASLAYLKSYGVDEKDVIMAPNSADTEFFSNDIVEKDGQGGQIRRQFEKEMPLAKFNLLFVGRLSPEKGFPFALEVLERLQGADLDVGLVVVGDGPFRSKYEALATEKRLKHVLFLGFKQPRELPYYYRMGDLLIMPSTSEPWGLVVNEAMTCGIPVLCSPKVGAAQDLVIEDSTGFQCESVEVYESHIRELVGNPLKRKEMGKNCREIIKKFTPQACGAGFANAFRKVSSLELCLRK